MMVKLEITPHDIPLTTIKGPSKGNSFFASQTSVYNIPLLITKSVKVGPTTKHFCSFTKVLRPLNRHIWFCYNNGYQNSLIQLS
jgi:hypothetical protein